MDSNRAEIRQRIDDWFKRHGDEMLADLAKVIAVKSVLGPAAEGAPFGKPSREALDLARSMLEERGFEVEMFEDMIISADMGPTPPLMGILAHLDVVDAGEGWDTDPYEMTIKDGRIIARGATDNKGPAVAAMYAMYCARDLCPELRHGFRLILGSGEETGCTDVVNYISKVEPPPNVFTPDAEFPVVNTEKGRFVPFFKASWEEDKTLPRVVSITGGKTTNVVPNRATAVLQGIPLGEVEAFCREYTADTDALLTAHEEGGNIVVTAVGESAHAARPYIGINAQTALVKMLSAMPLPDTEGHRRIRALDRLLPHGDHAGCALDIEMNDEISGGLTVSFDVLSYTTTDLAGNFDSRTPSCADKVDIAGIVRDKFAGEGLDVSHVTISKCHHTSKDTPFVQSLLRLYEEYTGKPGECLITGGSTYAHGIPGGVAFGIETPGESNKIHEEGEFVGVEQLFLSAKMFAQAIIDMCGA
jgi:succinyl-diaminopimelate desuccinylase